MQLLQQLAPAPPDTNSDSNGVVLLGWSMGGAAVIEAGARLSSSLSSLGAAADPTAGAAWGQPQPLRLAGIITLASQAAGLLRLGNAHGRVSSLHTALRILASAARRDAAKASSAAEDSTRGGYGCAGIPIVAMHGTRDVCVRPDCTDKIASLWSAPGQARKVVLDGDDHAVPSAFRHVIDVVDEMLPRP